LINKMCLNKMCLNKMGLNKMGLNKMGLNKMGLNKQRRMAWGLRGGTRMAAGSFRGGCPQGMAGSNDTLESPWTPLAIRPCK
jgi:hypothetical protein